MEEITIVRNCHNCDLLGSDGDGPEYNGSWPVCELTYCHEDESVEDNTDKPGFPFDEEQPCHVPGFWAYLEDPELKEMFDKEVEESDAKTHGPTFDKTFARFMEKYRSEEVTTQDAEHTG